MKKSSCHRTEAPGCVSSMGNCVNRDTIVLDEPVVVELVARVTSQGYADDLDR